MNKFTLKNGLRVITIPQKGARSATAFVLVGTGSKYEKKEINGISHFLEHMFFKGTKNKKKPLDLLEVLDKIGGSYNAFTGEEYTGYYAKVEDTKIETAVEWLADVYLNSLIPSKELEKEKGVIIEEINMYNDSPMDYVTLLWPKLLYGNQPAGRFIAGTKKTVMGIDRKKMVDYKNKQYVASNTVICVAGNVTEKDSVALVKKYFSKVTKGNIIEKPKVIEKQNNPGLIVGKRKTDQTHLILGVRAYNMFDDRKYALSLLGNMLGGMMSSRMFMEIREKLGLAYYVRTSVEADTDTGALETSAGVDNKRAGLAVKAILKEYKKIAQKKVSELELQKSKDFIKGKMALGLESSDAKAFFYLKQELFNGKLKSLDDIFKKIDAVTPEDIQKVAKDIFVPEKLNLAVVGPFEDKKFIDIINNF
jgi:predicted Zn-dependent peptidase